MELLVGGDVEVGVRLADALERVAERGGEVLLVAEQDVDLLDELRGSSRPRASGPPLAFHSDGR